MFERTEVSWTFYFMFLFSALLLVQLLRFRQFFCKYWVSWAQKADFEPCFKRASQFVKIIVACPHHLPKLPESTQRKQAIPNKGSLFYSHCDSTCQLPSKMHVLMTIPVLFCLQYLTSFHINWFWNNNIVNTWEMTTRNENIFLYFTSF
jgi:hypothetical protein